MTTAPGEPAASRASPTGVSGESAAARATAPAAPTAPMMAARARPSSHELPRPQAHRGQGLAIILLGDELPGGGLPDDGQPGQRGQAGQHPPAHGLRPDRALHRGSVDIQVVGRRANRSGRSWLSKAGRSAAPCRSCT